MLKINKEIKFDKPFIKRSLKIMVPIILAQILIVTVGFVDNFMVTGFDSEQIHLTAVGAGAEMWFGMSSLYFAVGIVFSLFYAQFSVEPSKVNFKQTFKLNIHVSIIVALLVSFIMYIFASQIMSLFFLSDSTSPLAMESKKWAIDYFKIMALGNIFASLSYMLLNPLLIVGKAKYMLFVSVVSLLTNILLDYLMIYVIDAKGTEGAVGAAWSTIISYFIQLLISIYLFFRNRKLFTGIGNLFKINKNIAKIFLKRSWMILSVSMMSISLVALTIIWSNMYGSQLIKSMAIAYAVSSIMFSIFPAINQGIKIIIGPKLGEGLFDEAKVFSKYLFRVIMIIVVVMSLLGIVGAFTLPVLLINDESYREKAQVMILIYSFAMLFFSTNSYFTGVLEIGGHKWQPTIFNYFSQIWLVMPISILLGPWVIGMSFEWTFAIAQGSSSFLALIAYILYKRDKWLVNLNKDKSLA